jgi:hypothetical protein
MIFTASRADNLKRWRYIRAHQVENLIKHRADLILYIFIDVNL